MYAVFTNYISNGESPGLPPIELIIMLASCTARKNKNLEGTKIRIGPDG